jgi:hypothetical protein
MQSRCYTSPTGKQGPVLSQLLKTMKKLNDKTLRAIKKSGSVNPIVRELQQQQI